AVRTLPPRSAVVIRPHAMSDSQQRQIPAMRRIARARGHVVLLAGAHAQWADGIHASGHGGARTAAGLLGRNGGHTGGRRPFLSIPVHNVAQARAAARRRADAILVSPLYPTRSHPGAATARLRQIRIWSAQAGAPAIALGGMTAQRFRIARRHGARGWAAIDAWIRDG
nr:thiamine phosphate synthase [Sphingopyxis sp.]